MRLSDLDAQYADLRSRLTEYLLGGGRLAVVKAPPGSGKTFTLIEVLGTLVSAGRRIAVAAQTNSQADDICARFAMAHPAATVARFASKSTAPGAEIPPAVRWVTDKRDLPSGHSVAVGTTAKWSLTDIADPYDLLAVDEAWQMSWADLMQCATVSGRFMMIGDPGQIPPVVAIDVQRWETSPRAPHRAAPEVVLGDDALAAERLDGSLPACRRLPHEAVDFVRPFYDFDFAAYVEPGSRALDGVQDRGWRDSLSAGRPLALTIPTPDHGPPIEVDHDLARAAATVCGRLLAGGATLRMGGETRKLTGADIGVTSSHRVMNAAVVAALGSSSNGIRVDTPERWQGLERPVMVALHPLSGVADPSAFDLETGRLCVMASRHQAAFILLTRDHIPVTLSNYVPGADQAPGRQDVVGRGHDAHLRFWRALEAGGCVRPLT